MAEKITRRIAYIDWLRGFACLVMFQTHCYDSWLGGAARDGRFLQMSQLGGTLPAPMFLFLAGISFALVTDKLRQKGVAAGEIARTTILRGGEIFLLGLLFRAQEFLLGQPRAPWTDLLRVDILNVIGVSLILMGVACRVAAAGGSTDLRQLRQATIVTAVICAGAIAILTPPLWTSLRPHSLAWWLESYIDGVHTFGQPQPWLFPIFPWAASRLWASRLVCFYFVSGLEKTKRRPWRSPPGGAALIALGMWLDALPVRLYKVYDFGTPVRIFFWYARAPC